MTGGTEETVQVVLRGNSASGKSSVAAGLRARFGRGLAVVGQDNLRRTVLRERDQPGAANIGLEMDLLPGRVETVRRETKNSKCCTMPVTRPALC